MSSLVLQPTSTAQWHALVHEAQSAVDHRLEEALESYLVFLLMRFVDRPEIANAVMALEFLEGVRAQGRERHDMLRNLGDVCLLYSGLFPEQANRRRVKLGYFVGIGRSAYHHLAYQLESQDSELFIQLAEDFVCLMDVLQAMRRVNQQTPGLDLLSTFELWAETGSKNAYHALTQATRGTPFTEESLSGARGDKPEDWH